jgi:hypothetical protein
MGVQRGRTGGSEFLVREETGELGAFTGPVRVPFIEDQGQSAPADVTHEHGAFVVGSGAAFGLQALEERQRDRVVAALLGEGTFANFVPV